MKPELNPTGDLENDYAIALLSPELFCQLTSESAPNIQIKTYYGTIIVSPRPMMILQERIVLCR